MSAPCTPSRPGAAARFAFGRCLALIALLLACPGIAPAGEAPAEPGTQLWTWIAAGPYRPVADEGHWIDPRGTAVVVVGAGVHTISAPVMALGLECIGWRASYATPNGSGLPPAGPRMHGEYLGLGPVCKARFTSGRWEPSVSATLLLVQAHMEWPSSFVDVPGDVEIENGWQGTLALSADVGVRLWRGGGVSLRGEYVPLTVRFGALSNGSADAGVRAVMLAAYHHLRWPGRPVAGR